MMLKSTVEGNGVGLGGSNAVAKELCGDQDVTCDNLQRNRVFGRGA